MGFNNGKMKLNWYAIADWFLLMIFASPILFAVLGVITILTGG